MHTKCVKVARGAAEGNSYCARLSLALQTFSVHANSI